ncbi:nucleotide exchange factor GrpE [Pontimonas sp.]|jgi:molecular chaperone GrpE|nr:nucleotide exchange factor GrpE [Pontimonas sp.]
MADTKNPQPEGDEEPQEPLFTDKRRVDPDTGDVRPEVADDATSGDITEEDLALLQDAERDLVAEYRDRAARAEAELQNFRTRVERDRQANRETVIAEVIRSLLPVMDDLDRAEAHGDLAGTPLELVAQKLRSGFERYGIKPVGEVGEGFDPAIHEAMVRLPEAGATGETVAEVIEGGYTLGERLIRPAKVAVKVPADD